ncbi:MULTISPECIES: ABC transporter permease [Shewanella]|jgi:putative ABC transport system permease protein|uniref:ABC transporter permease n=1 Tax=Shewanella TaxID=22 RepID=UPI00167AC272|nr:MULTISPECIES: ABC transporter permease [Shewanella]MBO1270928.1 ABC transporter permease [Shewanella sp. 4t3-1-2LB]MCL2906984.1 ABC transporter permease [Shewanella fodinae]GGZ05961.1 ABC macrolide family export system permease 2 [Shewanella fodinae]
MLSYYLQLAWLSVRRTPVMSLLMILTLAVGVAVSMTMLTLQHVMSTNGLAAKNDTLYALQIDNASAGDGGTSSGNKLTNGLPYLLSYRTVTTLLRSDIPLHQVAMHRWAAALSLENNQVRPSKELVRVTSRDFFALFGVPFIYGQVWDKSADNDARYQVVIDRTMNQRLFNGENSVGRSLQLDGRPYQVVGVVEDFNPLPSVQDLTQGAFGGNASIYLPFGLHRALQMMPYGSMTYSSSHPRPQPQEPLTPEQQYEQILQERYFWMQYWVELPDADTKNAFVSYLRNYFDEQRKTDFFERDFKYALSTPSQWLALNQVVSNDTRVMTWLALVFLAVCIINTIALLLAKLLKQAPETGIRRALGASRSAIFIQNLVESGVIGVLGGLLGIALSQLGLGLVRTLVSRDEAAVVYSDGLTLLLTIALALLASIIAGCYPAWRVSRTSPAYYLKNQ